MAYSTLDADRIEATLVTLSHRIEERFPDRGLTKLCQHLLAIAREDKRTLAWAAKPNVWLRAGVAVAIISGIAGLIWFATSLPRFRVEDEVSNVLQGVDAAVNTVALSGAASWFLLNLESRWRRRAVLRDLHELRSVAHVVDMHQLTKDPEALLRPDQRTEHSPPRNLNRFELTRYLDYCSEMLSITAKLAAMYAQESQDAVVLGAVREIESLSSDMSSEVWQKALLLQIQQSSEGA